MKISRLAVVALSATLAFGAPAQASDEDTKKAIITAAVIAGIAALIHQHRKSGKYDGHENWEREFERGYRDGYHNNRFNNHNHSNAYREGYQAGRQASGNHSSNDDYWHDNNQLHKPSKQARKACTQQASKRWRINKDVIVVGHYEAVKGNRFSLIMTSGRYRGECIVNNNGNIKQFTNLATPGISNNHRPVHIGSSSCPRQFPKGSKQCEVYQIGVNMGRADRRANATFLPGRHSGMYNGKYQPAFIQGYRSGWDKKARSTR